MGKVKKIVGIQIVMLYTRIQSIYIDNLSSRYYRKTVISSKYRYTNTL